MIEHRLLNVEKIISQFLIVKFFIGEADNSKFKIQNSKLRTNLSHNLVVVEVVFHAFHVLVVLMTLASYEHHVALLCHHAGCADGLAAVYYRDNFLHLLRV